MRNVEVLHPQRMRVEFALFEKDQLLHQGELLIVHERNSSCFGTKRLLPTARNGNLSNASLFHGLQIEHEFDLPAASLKLSYFQILPDKSLAGAFLQFERFNAALQMGVHLSKDWESVDLNGFDFAFLCEPLA